LKSTGNEKAHATVVLAAKGDGSKFKPFVVFKKGIREVDKLQQTPGIIVRSSSNGWMNDGLTSDWLRTVYTRFAFRHRLLVWDSYKCHISESTKNFSMDTTPQWQSSLGDAKSTFKHRILVGTSHSRHT